MANYSIKADLLKLQGAFVTNIKGKTATKQCLCIPIAESGLFLGKQGCYLNLTAIEMQNPRFEDTHCIKVQFDKAIYDNKYTVTSEMQEFRNGYREGDGLEVQGVKADECYFITQYSAPGGTITLYISKYMQLEMVYEVDGSSSGSGSSFNSSDI